MEVYLLKAYFIGKVSRHELDRLQNHLVTRIETSVASLSCEPNKSKICQLFLSCRRKVACQVLSIAKKDAQAFKNDSGYLKWPITPLSRDNILTKVITAGGKALESKPVEGSRNICRIEHDGVKLVEKIRRNFVYYHEEVLYCIQNIDNSQNIMEVKATDIRHLESTGARKDKKQTFVEDYYFLTPHAGGCKGKDLWYFNEQYQLCRNQRVISDLTKDFAILRIRGLILTPKYYGALYEGVSLAAKCNETVQLLTLYQKNTRKQLLRIELESKSGAELVTFLQLSPRVWLLVLAQMEIKKYHLLLLSGSLVSSVSTLKFDIEDNQNVSHIAFSMKKKKLLMTIMIEENPF